MLASRQLAAILFTDIVGYTAIMHRNEQEAVAVIRRYNTVMTDAVAKHGGEILNFYGDGCLCVFPSLTEALHCAVNVQRQLQEPPVVPLRMGLHIGEVFFEEGKVLGDDVNIASRILSLGGENTVLLSAEARDKIRNQPSFKAVSLGAFRFKNVDEPIEVFALANEGLRVPLREDLSGKLQPQKGKKRTKWIGVFLGLGLLVLMTYLIYSGMKDKAGSVPKEKSLAVLPFENISNDSEQDYFSDGITEEIITQLSKVSDLRVISRSTAMLYKSSNKPTKQIAQELGVAAILEGSIRKAGDDIRITAQLIDARSQEQLWAESYDHQRLGDVFSIQSEVAQQIARELDARLSIEEKVNIEKKPTHNPEAYHLLLQARYAYGHAGDFRGAEKFLLKAIQLDSSFALAYSYLANLYVLSASWSGHLKPDEGARKAMNVLQRKLPKDTLYIDFNTLASIEFLVRKNYPRAEYYYKRSIRAYPKEEFTYDMYALLLTILGRTDEALVQLDKAKALSPVSTFEAIQRAEVYFAAGQFDEAIDKYQNAIQVFPHEPILYDGLGRCFVQQQRYTEAIDILSQGLARRSGRQPSTVAYLALAYHRLNNAKQSGALIKELKQRAAKKEKGTNVFIALYYSAIQDKEEAFYYLEQAFGTGDVDLIWLKQEPSFKTLQSDPRFGTYLKRAGF